MKKLRVLGEPVDEDFLKNYEAVAECEESDLMVLQTNLHEIELHI